MRATCKSGRRLRVEGQRPASHLRLSTLGFRRSTIIGLALFFFALGLMSKPMVVTLPFVLLLLDFWPLGRVPGFKFEIPGSPSLATSRRLFDRKNSILHAGCDSLCHHLFPEKHGRRYHVVGRIAVHLRMENALVSYGEYLHKIFWPASLANPYPLQTDWPLVTVTVAAMLVGGLCFAAFRWGRKFPFLTTGCFGFSEC